MGLGGKIDEREIFPQKNHVSIFMNLNSPSCSVIMSVTDEYISDLITPLVSLSIDKENPAIEISQYQVHYSEDLPEEQLLNGDV